MLPPQEHQPSQYTRNSRTRHSVEVSEANKYYRSPNTKADANDTTAGTTKADGNNTTAGTTMTEVNDATVGATTEINHSRHDTYRSRLEYAAGSVLGWGATTACSLASGAWGVARAMPGWMTGAGTTHPSGSTPETGPGGFGLPERSTDPTTGDDGDTSRSQSTCLEAASGALWRYGTNLGSTIVRPVTRRIWTPEPPPKPTLVQTFKSNMRGESSEVPLTYCQSVRDALTKDPSRWLAFGFTYMAKCLDPPSQPTNLEVFERMSRANTAMTKRERTRGRSVERRGKSVDTFENMSRRLPSRGRVQFCKWRHRDGRY